MLCYQNAGLQLQLQELKQLLFDINKKKKKIETHTLTDMLLEIPIFGSLVVAPGDYLNTHDQLKLVT